jgi:phospholipase C
MSANATGAAKVEHVVLLMLENRSFDHMLGFLDHGGLEPVSATPLPNPDDPAVPGSATHTAFALEATTPSPLTPSTAIRTSWPS